MTIPAEETLLPAVRCWAEPDAESGYNVKLEAIDSGNLFLFALPPREKRIPARLAKLLAEDTGRQLLDFARWLFAEAESEDDDPDGDVYAKLFGGDPNAPVAPDHETALLAELQLDSLEEVSADGQTQARQEAPSAPISLGAYRASRAERP